MRIGLDLDNTIVRYDRLFHTVACERALLPEGLPETKLAVRDHLRSTAQEAVWTRLQGEVYGLRMIEADPHEGAIDAIRAMGAQGHEIFVISHRTPHPYLGPAYDLHASARQWIDRHLCLAGEPLLPSDHVFLETTTEDKVRRIEQCGCDVFVDDLPEILLEQTFPSGAQAILFDPDRRHSGSGTAGLTIVSSWDELMRQLTW